jgi:hypothetical protein
MSAFGAWNLRLDEGFEGGGESAISGFVASRGFAVIEWTFDNVLSRIHGGLQSWSGLVIIYCVYL